MKNSDLPSLALPHKISGIILSAGKSSRFGSPKALARVNGQEALARIIHSLTTAGCADIIAVLGHQADLIKPALKPFPNTRAILNARYEFGQTSSFKAGLDATRPDCEAVFLWPVDTPLVKPSTIALLLSTFLKNHPVIVVPRHDGRCGHPSLFSRALLDEFRHLPDESPLFTVQRRHHAQTVFVDVQDPGILKDFNTPEEFRKLSIPA